MFYSQEILSSGSGGFSTVWLVATLGSKSTLCKVHKRDILNVSIPDACNLITDPPIPLALRLSSNLLFGTARVYAQQSSYFYNDTLSTYNRLRKLNAIKRDSDTTVAPAKARPEILSLADDPNFIINVSCNPLMMTTEYSGGGGKRDVQLPPPSPFFEGDQIRSNETSLLDLQEPDSDDLEVSNEENPDLLVTFEFGEDGSMHDLLPQEQHDGLSPIEPNQGPVAPIRVVKRQATRRKRVINDESTRLDPPDMDWDTYLDRMNRETRVKRARLARRLSRAIAHEFIGGRIGFFERYMSKRESCEVVLEQQQQQRRRPEEIEEIERGLDATPEAARARGGNNSSVMMPWSASATDNSRLRIVRGASQATPSLILPSRRMSYLDTPLARHGGHQQQEASSSLDDDELLYMNIEQEQQQQHELPESLDADAQDFYYFLQMQGAGVEFDELIQDCPSETSPRIVAVRAFENILQLATRNVIYVDQTRAWGPIQVGVM